jgi:TBC1 domain family protein 5
MDYGLILLISHALQCCLEFVGNVGRPAEFLPYFANMHLVLTADYTTALTLLLRYPSPEPHTPQTFVHDALYLEQNPTADRGSFIISKYSGRPPDSKLRNNPGTRPTRKAFLWEDFKKRSGQNSPGSPSRNSPKSLESLLQDVSQGIQRRTEAWGVAKAVRGAVTEARKNMQTMHHEANMRPGFFRPLSAASASDIQPMATTASSARLETKINLLEERNQALATILREALDDLGSQLANIKELDSDTNSAVKQALAKAESVQVYLGDSSIPVDPRLNPGVDGELNQTGELQASDTSPMGKVEGKVVANKAQSRTISPTNAETTGPKAESGTDSIPKASRRNSDRKPEGSRAIPSRSTVRPSMTDSGFSWMLGGGRNLSGFVSSTSPPPEQTRHLDQTRGKPNVLFGSSGEENPGTNSGHSELALHSLRGSRDPLSGTGP